MQRAQYKTECLFYDLYPSKNIARSQVGLNPGVFEDLLQYIPAGFDGKAVVESGIFAKDYLDGGFFFYSKHQKYDIERMKFSGEGKPNVEKYSEMVSYLFEVAFELALGGVPFAALQVEESSA